VTTTGNYLIPHTTGYFPAWLIATEDWTLEDFPFLWHDKTLLVLDLIYFFCIFALPFLIFRQILKSEFKKSSLIFYIKKTFRYLVPTGFTGTNALPSVGADLLLSLLIIQQNNQMTILIIRRPNVSMVSPTGAVTCSQIQLGPHEATVNAADYLNIAIIQQYMGNKNSKESVFAGSLLKKLGIATSAGLEPIVSTIAAVLVKASSDVHVGQKSFSTSVRNLCLTNIHKANKRKSCLFIFLQQRIHMCLGPFFGEERDVRIDSQIYSFCWHIPGPGIFEQETKGKLSKLRSLLLLLLLL
ncbi:hypothetical protein ACJX0J_014072, partial [Zea mays]